VPALPRLDSGLNITAVSFLALVCKLNLPLLFNSASPRPFSVSEFVPPSYHPSMNDQYQSMDDPVAWDDWLQFDQPDW
jgi:hypothetical protein